MYRKTTHCPLLPDSAHPNTDKSYAKRGVGSFGREAQAAYLLHRVFQIMNIDDPEIIQKSAAELDKDLQKFAGIVMKQAGGVWGFYCGVNAMAIK